MRPLDLKWFEDPVPIANFDAQKRVRDESPIPICAGEMLTPDQFREMIDRRAVDIIHPDLLFVGGLHEGKKVADYADLNAIPMAIHNNGSAMNTIAEAHLARPPARTSSASSTTSGTRSGSRKVVRREGVETVRRARGSCRSPTRPGFGVEVDQDIARRYLAPGESLF